jgi:PKD repeat protein
MSLTYARTRLGAVTAGLALAITACTVHKTETPPLTGPSELGTSFTIQASPDVLTQDGASQSLVTVTARNNNGQPVPNLSFRADISVGGVITDFGRLSAKNLVTDGSGRATLVYTAPPAPALIVGNGTTVDIQITPIGSNFDNTNPRFASIRLVPPGVIPAPVSPFVPSFPVGSPSIGDNVIFTATVTDPAHGNADVTNQIASFQWSFGDGGTASGQSVTHVFTRVGTFPVTLTITDSLGRTNFVTQSITVGQGQLPTATFVVSPAAPVVNQTINFNASGSTAAPGHVITDYAWTFGDGTSAGGAIVTHSYSQAGTFTVTLQVTDEVGRKSSLISQTITVTNGNPVAQITVSPPTGPVTTTFSFIGSQSTAAPGRTIVRYDWNFGDSASGSGATTSHRYLLPGTYTVTLTVTDDQGKQGIATVTVVVTT